MEHGANYSLLHAYTDMSHKRTNRDLALATSSVCPLWHMLEVVSGCIPYLYKHEVQAKLQESVSCSKRQFWA